MSTDPDYAKMSGGNTANTFRNTIKSYMNPDVSNPAVKVSTKYKEDPNLMMRATEWHGTKDIRSVTRPAPTITDPADAVVRVTTAAICGSDLHMYFGVSPIGDMMHDGDVMGHETMGVVTKVGPDVKNIKVGQRVVVSAPISCGQCEFCQREEYSLCESTNPSSMNEKMMGQRLAGVFGYSHMVGGFAGGQAEYCRVPFADVNLLPVPDHLPDRSVILLSDVLCTAWHGNELADVGQGDTVVVFGAGPVGLMAAYLAHFRGAKRVISIDRNPQRLVIARERCHAETIDVSNTSTDVVQEIFRLVPGGPNRIIDCVGFRFPKSTLEYISQSLKLQTDVTEVIKESAIAIRKGGHLALIGDYFGWTNGFPIGQLMEKAIQIRGGQLYAQKYWKTLLKYIDDGSIDATWLISHELKLELAPEGYKIFSEQNASKVILRTDFGLKYETEHKADFRINPEHATAAIHQPRAQPKPSHLTK